MTRNTGNIQYGFWDLSYSQRLDFPLGLTLASYRLEFPMDERKLHVRLCAKTSFAQHAKGLPQQRRGAC